MPITRSVARSKSLGSEAAPRDKLRYITLDDTIPIYIYIYVHTHKILMYGSRCLHTMLYIYIYVTYNVYIYIYIHTYI